jgi:hypothetical protein
MPRLAPARGPSVGWEPPLPGANAGVVASLHDLPVVSTRAEASASLPKTDEAELEHAGVRRPETATATVARGHALGGPTKPLTEIPEVSTVNPVRERGQGRAEPAAAPDPRSSRPVLSMHEDQVIAPSTSVRENHVPPTNTPVREREQGNVEIAWTPVPRSSYPARSVRESQVTGKLADGLTPVTTSRTRAAASDTPATLHAVDRDPASPPNRVGPVGLSPRAVPAAAGPHDAVTDGLRTAFEWLAAPEAPALPLAPSAPVPPPQPSSTSPAAMLSIGTVEVHVEPARPTPPMPARAPSVAVPSPPISRSFVSSFGLRQG